MKAREVSKEEVWPLRHRILRPHQPAEKARYETDYEESTFHIGVFENNQLISCASFNQEKVPFFNTNYQYRLRAMLTLKSQRHKGAGKLVVQTAESKLQQRDVSLLWCKGRVTVQEYYERLGFTPHGKEFDYPGLGPHILLVKNLK